MDKNEEYADRIIQEAMLIASGGFDAEVAAEAVSSALKSVKLQADLLVAETEKLISGEKKNINCPECHRNRLDLDRLARAMQCSARMVDEVTRLSSFCSQRSDPKDNSNVGWLSALPDDKIEIIRGWLKEYSRG